VLKAECRAKVQSLATSDSEIPSAPLVDFPSAQNCGHALIQQVRYRHLLAKAVLSAGRTVGQLISIEQSLPAISVDFDLHIARAARTFDFDPSVWRFDVKHFFLVIAANETKDRSADNDQSKKRFPQIILTHVHSDYLRSENLSPHNSLA